MGKVNFSESRNFPYGVFIGHSCTGLVDDIQQNGVSLTMKALDDAIEVMAEQIKELAAKRLSREEFFEDLKDILRADPLNVEDFDDAFEALDDHVEDEPASEDVDDENRIVTGILQAAELPSTLSDLISDSLESPEEEAHFWDAGDCKLQTGYLGGAIHVWVIDSSYITNAGACSPCVPGAGNLDCPRQETDGYPCLCLPLSYYADYEWDEDAVPLFLQEIDDKGNLVGNVRTKQEGY